MLDRLKGLLGQVSEDELYQELGRALRKYEEVTDNYNRFKEYQGLYSLVNDPAYEIQFKKLVSDVSRVQREAINKRVTFTKEKKFLEVELEKSLGNKDVPREEVEDVRKRIKELERQEERLFNISIKDTNAIYSLELSNYGPVGKIAEKIRYRMSFGVTLKTLEPENVGNMFLREFKKSEGELIDNLHDLDKQLSEYFSKVETYLQKNDKLPTEMVGDDAVLKRNLMLLFKNEDVTNIIVSRGYPILSKLKDELVAV